MTPTTQGAQRALLVVLGIAATTFSNGIFSNASAEEPALLRALRSPQHLPAVDPVAFTTNHAMPEDSGESDDTAD